MAKRDVRVFVVAFLLTATLSSTAVALGPFDAAEPIAIGDRVTLVLNEALHRVFPESAVILDQLTTVVKEALRQAFGEDVSLADHLSAAVKEALRRAFGESVSVADQLTAAVDEALRRVFPESVAIVDTLQLAHVKEIVVDAGPDHSVAEGDLVTLTGSASGGTGGYSYAWSVVRSTGPAITLINPDSATSGFRAIDDGEYDVRLLVTDASGGAASDTVTVHVLNVAPANLVITSGPRSPVAVGTAVSLQATFTDPGSLDTESGTWTWGDGASSPAVITGSAGSFQATGGHTYTTPGVFEPELRVSDDDGGTAAASFQYVVVYAPAGAFATGAGSISVASGAFTGDPTVSGLGRFGFVARYTAGASIPTGRTDFRVAGGALEFNSTGYDWLVASGDVALLRGSGKLNDVEGYVFQVTARDGERLREPDRFQIQIWDGAGWLVFDSSRGSDTAISGGNIVVHQ